MITSVNVGAVRIREIEVLVGRPQRDKVVVEVVIEVAHRAPPDAVSVPPRASGRGPSTNRSFAGGETAGNGSSSTTTPIPTHPAQSKCRWADRYAVSLNAHSALRARTGVTSARFTRNSRQGRRKRSSDDG